MTPLKQLFRQPVRLFAIYPAGGNGFRFYLSERRRIFICKGNACAN